MEYPDVSGVTFLRGTDSPDAMNSERRRPFHDLWDPVGSHRYARRACRVRESGGKQRLSDLYWASSDWTFAKSLRAERSECLCNSKGICLSARQQAQTAKMLLLPPVRGYPASRRRCT